MKIDKKCPMCGSDNIIIRMVGDWKQYFVCFCGDCTYTPVPSNKASLLPYFAIKKWNKYCSGMKLCRDCDGKSHHPALIYYDYRRPDYRCPKCKKLWNISDDE